MGPESAGKVVPGLWHRLTSAPGEQAPAIARRTRLLLTIIVCLILVVLVGLALLPLQYRLAKDAVERRAASVTYPLLYGGFLACLLLAFAVARAGRHGAAGLVIAFLAMLGSYASVLATGQELGLVTIGLGPLIAGLLLSWRATLVVSIVATGMMLTVPPFVPELTYVRVASSFLVMLALGALSVVSAVLRNRDLAQIEEQGRRLVEEQEHLAAARKMEAIARLSAGVAHEFNNLLAGIMGYAQVIALKPAESAAGHARKILDAGTRASRLVEHLLSFSRQQLMRPVAVSLNTLVSERASRASPAAAVSLGREAELTVLDPELVGQALETLIRRAAQDSPPGAVVTITTRDVVVTGSGDGLPPGPYRVVTVSDAGPPRDPEILHRVFDPFYTTGELGTGDLDLAAAYGIVSQAGGHLSAGRSTTGGNTYIVHLPAFGGTTRGKG